MSCPVNIAAVASSFPDTVERISEATIPVDGARPERIAAAGVDQRRIAAPGTDILDLAETACRKALRAANLTEVDRLVLVTSTLRPAALVPSGVILLQDRLGLRNCQSSTLLDTCCGSLVAMEYAAAVVRAGMARNVLVVAAETFSTTFHPLLPVECEIGLGMGDGAAAVVLTGRPDWEDGLAASFTRSSADFQSGLGMRPVAIPSQDGVRAAVAFRATGAPPTFRGQPVAGDQLVEALHWFTSKTVPEAIAEALARSGLSREEVDFFILHQPNRRFLETWKTEARVPPERTLDTLAHFGNLSSVSVLANLDAAHASGKLEVGSRVLLAAAGEGATWGAMIWRWRVAKRKDES